MKGVVRGQAAGPGGVIVAGLPPAGDNYAAGIGKSNCRRTLTSHPGRSVNLIVAGREKEMSLDTQRLYEALRAICVEGCRQKYIAERFGYDYAAFRQQVTRFRARCAAGQSTPFLPPCPPTARRRGGGQQGRPNSRQLTTTAPSAWTLAAASAPAWSVSS